MNELTICLITKGRIAFMDSILNSLSECLDYKNVSILIIDNGSSNAANEKLRNWATNQNVELIRFEKNDTKPNRIWNELLERKIGWVVFPGDDDVFLPSVLSDFFDLKRKMPDLSGISCPMEVLKESGQARSDNKYPPIKFCGSSIEALGNSFHEPQFFWPALFMNLQVLPAEVPTSRYAFDWWIGIQLLISGEVAYLNKPAVRYRIHPNQESNLVLSRRKYFESWVWLSSLCDSAEFQTWMNKRSDRELLEFWKQVSESSPIYGDKVMGYSLLKLITDKLVFAVRDKTLVSNIYGSLSAIFGVHLKEGDVKNLLPASISDAGSASPNINLKPSFSACNAFIDTVLTLQNSAFIEVAVGCNHSNSHGQEFRFDCSQFEDLPLSERIDLILLDYSNYLETTGELDFMLTPNEEKIIVEFRKYQNRIPRWLILIAKVWIKRVKG